MDKNVSTRIRLLILGDQMCGKSSLIKKVKCDEFDINYYESNGI